MTSPTVREHRRQKVVQRRAQLQRQIEWIASLSLPSEVGIGDTILRLRDLLRPQRHESLSEAIDRILQCRSCHRREAIAYLNAAYPYR